MYATNSEARPLLRGVLIEVWRQGTPIPSRPGFEKREATIAVWCPFCRQWHYHGWDPANDGRHAEHRVAHCGDGPLKEAGYWISTLRKKDPGYKEHVVRPGRVITRPSRVKS